MEMGKVLRRPKKGKAAVRGAERRRAAQAQAQARCVRGVGVARGATA